MTIRDLVIRYRNCTGTYSQFGMEMPMADRATFYVIRLVMEILAKHPDAARWNSVSQCHLFADLFDGHGCHKVDGLYGIAVPKKRGYTRYGGCHSWLETDANKYIIDVMPIGIYGGPLMYSKRKPYNIGQAMFHANDRKCLPVIRKVRATKEYQTALSVIRAAHEEIKEILMSEFDKRTE